MADEELPPGWRRVESRSKPGTFYYAHPASNKTQMTPPPGTKQVPKKEDVKEKVTNDTAKKRAVAEDKEVEKEHKRKRIEDVQETVLTEADEAEEAMRKAKAAKKDKEAKEKQRQEKEAREADEEQKRKTDAEALAQEKQKKEAETRKKEEDARKRKAAVFEQLLEQGNKMAEEARKKEEEDEENERRKQAAEKARIAKQREKEARIEKERLKEERENELWTQKLLDLSLTVEEPCFEIYKDGRLMETHVLDRDEQTSWIIGRMEDQADIVLPSDRISRKHAEVTIENTFLFLKDLGSTHGTAMNQEKLEANKSVELFDGARFRFGGLEELFVYREPAKEPDLSLPVEKPCFQVWKDGRLMKTHELVENSKKKWIIGRMPESANMVIPSHRISRQHALVTFEDPSMMLKDLGSSHGTAMDGDRLKKNEPVELWDGAKIRFGGLQELYVYREPFRERPPVVEPGPIAQITPVTAGAEKAAMGAVEQITPAGTDEDRIKRIQQKAHEREQKRQERKAKAAAPAPEAKKDEKKTAEDEERIRRIQQKRQAKKAAEAGTAAGEHASEQKESNTDDGSFF